MVVIVLAVFGLLTLKIGAENLLLQMAKILGVTVIIGILVWWIPGTQGGGLDTSDLLALRLSLPGSTVWSGRVIEWESLQAARQADEVIVFDARPASAFLQGALNNTVNVPVDGDVDEFFRIIEPFDKSAFIVVICASENCAWSKQVANRLRSAGFTNVSVFEPGIRGILERLAQEQAETPHAK